MKAYGFTNGKYSGSKLPSYALLFLLSHKPWATQNISGVIVILRLRPARIIVTYILSRSLNEFVDPMMKYKSRVRAERKHISRDHQYSANSTHAAVKHG